METCCNGGGGKIKSSQVIFPKVNKEEPVIISACGEQKFICLRFKAWVDSTWRNGGGKLEGLPTCKEFCDRLTWNEYKNKLENCEIEGFVDKDTGQYKVDWASGLEGYESCLKETSLSYKCHKDDGVELCTVSTDHPTAFNIDFCGDDTDAVLKFKKGDHEYRRHYKLRNAGECEEESNLEETIWIVIGIIIGVIIIVLLFFCLFKYEISNVDSEGISVSRMSALSTLFV